MKLSLLSFAVLVALTGVGGGSAFAESAAHASPIAAHAQTETVVVYLVVNDTFANVTGQVSFGDDGHVFLLGEYVGDLGTDGIIRDSSGVPIGFVSSLE